jgi:hypothetical protein
VLENPDGERLVEALQMENDLLTAEVAALRAELASGRREQEDPSARLISAERLERLTTAERDLKWLLRRLGGGARGRLLRHLAGYRVLEERHLGRPRRG